MKRGNDKKRLRSLEGRKGSAPVSILNHTSGTVEAIYLRREQEQ
jgi:hypothetical protein